METPHTIHGTDQRSATDMIHEVVESGKQTIEAGERVMKDLRALQSRAERAMDWRTQFATHPYWLFGVAIGGSLLASYMLREKR